MAYNNSLPANLPETLEVTIRKGVHPKTKAAQWESSVTTSQSNTVRVVVNEKERSGPHVECEVWGVRPRNYVPGILFADALYRAAHSLVVERSAPWYHPILLDIYERMVWDIRSVSSGGAICVGSWKWETIPGDRYNNYRSERVRQVIIEKEGSLKSIRSEAGWLYLTIGFSKEVPTDNDAYHREYWQEDFSVPCYQCAHGWTFLRDHISRMSFSPVIYAGEIAFKLPMLMEGGNRGAAEPFDISRVGQPRQYLSDEENDDLVAKLLPGRLVRFCDKNTVDRVAGFERTWNSDLFGVVSSLSRVNGEWEMRFEDNALWFEAKDSDWQYRKSWRKLGQPNAEEQRALSVFDAQSGQHQFDGFCAMRFRTLRIPGHRSHGWAPKFELVRDVDKPYFTGVLTVAATLPANLLLTGGAQQEWQEKDAARPMRFDVYGFDSLRGDYDLHLPEHLERRFR